MAPFSNILEATHFQPTTEAASDILSAFVDPDQSLGDIAARFHTTPDALALWLETPDIARRLDALERITARRTRLIAVANERTALGLLISVIEGHLYNEQHVPVNSQSLKAVTQRDRARATARIAASQLIRLANRAPLSPAPGGVGGGDVTSAASDRGGTPTPAGPEGRESKDNHHGLKPMATIARRGGEEKSGASNNRKHKLTRPASSLPFLASRDHHNFGGLLPRDLLNACGGSISADPLFGRPFGAWIDGAA